MSTGSYRQVLVQCPFYRKDVPARRQISCEGLVDKSSLSLNYQSKVDYEKQMEIFCCNRYINCEVYRMLMSKYPD